MPQKLESEVRYKAHLALLYNKQGDYLINEFVEQMGCLPSQYYADSINVERQDMWINTLMDNYHVDLYKRSQEPEEIDFGKFDVLLAKLEEIFPANYIQITIELSSSADVTTGNRRRSVSYILNILDHCCKLCPNYDDLLIAIQDVIKERCMAP